jgi:hypothetical protein
MMPMAPTMPPMQMQQSVNMAPPKPMAKSFSRAVPMSMPPPALAPLPSNTSQMENFDMLFESDESVRFDDVPSSVAHEKELAQFEGSLSSSTHARRRSSLSLASSLTSTRDAYMDLTERSTLRSAESAKWKPSTRGLRKMSEETVERDSSIRGKQRLLWSNLHCIGDSMKTL